MARRPKQGQLAVRIAKRQLERLRRAAWWDRRTQSAIVEEALRDWLDLAEKRRGGPYPKRQA